MKSLKSQASSLKNPVIHVLQLVLRSFGEGGNCLSVGGSRRYQSSAFSVPIRSNPYPSVQVRA